MASDAASRTPAPRLRLQAGDLVAEVEPDLGGSLASYFSRCEGGREHHWLRSAADAPASVPPALGMASFPLVPWCNRIRDGRFAWNGRVVQLAPNVPGSAHTIHGIGWQRRWQVEAASESVVELSLDEAGGGDWPFAFRARQRYSLDGRGLEIRIELSNTGAEAMPAGIGHHPYFVHRRFGTGTRVTAQVQAMWLGDAEVMPTTLSATSPTVAALATGMRLADFELDNNFTGIGRSARIDWPDGSRLRIDASEPLDFMVLYSPAADDVFVLEAVSNCTDWINLRARHEAPATPATVGGAVLQPGASLAATTRFEASLGEAAERGW